MQEKQTDSEIRVKLKPILGIRPGVYLTVIYSVILLFVLFLLLVSPGLRNPGEVLVVNTQPAGAAIRVNDVYMGLSGSRIFIPRGTYTIEAVMPGFKNQKFDQTMGGQIFGSLFFPRIKKIELTMNTSDPAAAFAIYAADYAEWTFGGEPTASWQIPLSLSEGAYRTGQYAGQANNELQEIIKASSRFAVTRAALRDLLRAKILLDNFGNAPSPAALVESVSQILAFLSGNPGSAGWISSLLPSSSPVVAAIEASDWYKYSDVSPIIHPVQESGNESQIQLAGINFINIPAAEIVLNANLYTAPYINNIHITSFMISETPVPKSLFDIFLDENPQWKEQHTDYFPDLIAVNPMEIFNRNAVTGITWYAAQAFCKWLTELLPVSMLNMEVRLPTEDEWLIAALSVNNMRNPGWEWCSDPYVHLPFITAAPGAAEIISSPERSLRGRASLTSMETRASLPPEFSSPVVTFRPVIAVKR